MVAKGFTLIELIIVVAIIAILVTVAMPAYQDYVVRTVNQSCLWEVKGYTNAVFLALNDEDARSSPPTVVVSACHNITDASSWIEGDGNHIIIAFSKSPANKRIECDIYEGATCHFIP